MVRDTLRQRAQLKELENLAYRSGELLRNAKLLNVPHLRQLLLFFSRRTRQLV